MFIEVAEQFEPAILKLSRAIVVGAIEAGDIVVHELRG